MTTMKRRLPIVFAIACALVLIGGSLEAPAGDLGSWNPVVTDSHGVLTVGNRDRKWEFKFHIVAMKNGERETVVCGRFDHVYKQGGGSSTERCGADMRESRGTGKFRVQFHLPKKIGSNQITKTHGRMKVRILTIAGGAWMESDYTKSMGVEW